MDKIKKYLFLAGIILVILCFWGIYTLKSTNINNNIAFQTSENTSNDESNDTLISTDLSGIYEDNSDVEKVLNLLKSNKDYESFDGIDISLINTLLDNIDAYPSNFYFTKEKYSDRLSYFKKASEEHEKKVQEQIKVNLEENSDFINEIQSKYPTFSIDSISGSDDEEKSLSIKSYKLNSNDETYNVVAEFLTYEETNLKRHNINNITFLYEYNGKSEGMICCTLSGGTYTPVINTLK